MPGSQLIYETMQNNVRNRNRAGAVEKISHHLIDAIQRHDRRCGFQGIDVVKTRQPCTWTFILYVSSLVLTYDCLSWSCIVIEDRAACSQMLLARIEIV